MYVSRLTLETFRNHSFIDLNFDPSPVVFYGENGSGKTNILEALSFFSVGKGMRGAKLADLVQNNTNNQPSSWKASLTLNDNTEAHMDVRLSSYWNQEKRTNKIQGEDIKSAAEFSEWLSLFWLTPAHDRLFVDASKIRRRFFDRMVFSFDPNHAINLVAYEQLMKERLTLLSKTRDDRWLNALEHKMAELSVKIIASRRHVLHEIQKASQNLHSLFPSFECKYEGDNNNETDLDALFYESSFKKMRDRDAQSHITTLGVHRHDFKVIHNKKGDATHCSTGEQKILLMGFVLSFLMSRLMWNEKLIVILLDECVSHFDFSHRMVLFEQINEIQRSNLYKGSLHTFISGTDRELFKSLEGNSMFFEVSASHVERK